VIHLNYFFVTVKNKILNNVSPAKLWIKTTSIVTENYTQNISRKDKVGYLLAGRKSYALTHFFIGDIIF